ncbi:glycosyltransferase [Chryseolinea sp. T2]|uniref:glycosyltransferase n=1 Tax=Chryseolinea sp. T2 TaxID=3129255 RepID=UPI00307826F5
MGHKLLVFDTHPVQYRVPIWQQMSVDMPGSVHVVYASDCSVRGRVDKEFGIAFSWDVPMMAGYEHTVLNCEKGTPLAGWGTLTGEGVREQIELHKPDAILLGGFNYRYDAVVYMNAKRMGIPLWLRCETQDHCFPRSKAKSIVRSLLYTTLYKGIDKIFYIGELNKQHYLNHGVPESKLTPARYFTVDRFAELSKEEKSSLRKTQREKAGIAENAFVIGFSGKLIEKKNPKILYEMQEYLPAELRSRIHLYFMGSGELEKDLRALTVEAERKYGSKAFFSGFVNQSQLAGHYLAMDLMVLPSRKMGETWGLVTNEAMQSGAGVIASDSVGSSADFGNWKQFRVFKDGDPKALADAVVSLAKFERNYDWALAGLETYSVKQTSDAFINAF